MSRTRRFVALIVMAILSVAMTADASNNQDFKKATREQQKGERALRQGKVDEARAAFEKAIELVEGFPPAHIGLGQIAMSEQRYPEALEHFEAAEAGYAEFGTMMAEVEAKRYSDAQKQIVNLRDQQQNMEQFSTDPQRSLKISQIENQIQQLESVEKPSAVEPGTAPAEVDFNIGNALFRMNQVEGAVTRWETCREKNPKFAMVYNNLALVYGRQGRFDEALASLDRAEELGFPVNPQFRADLEKAKANAGG